MYRSMIQNEHLYRAVQLAGNQSKLARLLEAHTGKKVAQSQVHDWLHGKIKRGIPAEYCQVIEQITNGLVTAEDLRPDVFRVVKIKSHISNIRNGLKAIEEKNGGSYEAFPR